jgi:hypothetical protein
MEMEVETKLMPLKFYYYYYFFEHVRLMNTITFFYLLAIIEVALPARR